MRMWSWFEQLFLFSERDKFCQARESEGDHSLFLPRIPHIFQPRLADSPISRGSLMFFLLFRNIIFHQFHCKYYIFSQLPVNFTTILFAPLLASFFFFPSFLLVHQFLLPIIFREHIFALPSNLSPLSRSLPSPHSLRFPSNEKCNASFDVLLDATMRPYIWRLIRQNSSVYLSDVSLIKTHNLARENCNCEAMRRCTTWTIHISITRDQRK